MTGKQRETIADNLRAFIHNFGEVRIEKEDYGKGFYVFYPANADSWTQFCYNIDYLNGWLYGAVQGVRVLEHAKKRAGITAPIDGEGF